MDERVGVFEEPPPKTSGGKELQATNSYVTKKTATQGMLDVALLLANASQLKKMLMIPGEQRQGMHYAVIVFISLSIILQVLTGILLTVLGFQKMRNEKSRNRVEMLNNVTVVMIVVITVLNIFINAFEIDISSKE